MDLVKIVERIEEKKIQETINLANKGQTILKNLDRANTMANFKNRLESQEQYDEDTEISNTVINTEFIKTQEHLKTSGEIVADFDAIVDNMEFSSEQTEDIGGVENIEAYKTQIKEGFAKDAKNYRAAKSLVNSIGLGGKLKDSVGNIEEMGEALTMSFMIGKTSLSKAENIAKQIDDMIGTEGVFNHLEHYNNLSQDKKTKISELKKKRRRLNDLRKLATKYGQQVEGVQIQSNRKLKPDTIQKNYNKFSEKYLLTQNAITTLEEELTSLSEALDLDLRAENVSLDGTIATDPSFQSTEAMIEELDKLDIYVASLEKAGKTEDATAIRGLISEFKTYSDAHRQMNSNFRRMFDTNFFKKTKEGAALKNTILGRKYVMTDEFRELIRENDRLIDESLKKSGVSGYVDIESFVEKSLANNEELSDREKYRRESIIRTILGAERVRNRLFEAQSEYKEVIESIQESNSSNPLEGDTVTLKKKINPEGKDLSNIDIINQMINDIVEEIDALRKVGGQEEEIKNLEERLAQVKEIDIEEEVEPGDHEKAMIASRVPEEERTEEQATLLENYNTFVEREYEVNKISREIADLKANKKFKLVSTEEYQKLKDLVEKRQKGTINSEELIDLQEVTDEIDQWLMITGTVVEGIRLSDLIKQKVVLEETPITKVENVSEVVAQEVIDQIDLSDETGAVNYSYGQTFEGVTAINTKKGIEISGINPTMFEEITGVTEYEVNEKGNIIITRETQQAINSGGILSILPTNKDLTTNYSVVLVTRNNLNGERETSPLTSTFNEDFNGEMDPDAIYTLTPGDELTLEVNPEDAYNQQLLADYKKSVGTANTTVVSEEDITEALEEDTKYQDLLFDLEGLEEDERNATTLKKPSITKKKNKKKEAVKKRKETIENKLIKEANKGNKKSSKKSTEDALEELRRALVIRVKTPDGKFVAVLKAKRKAAIKSVESNQFEDLRDQIVTDADFMSRLVETGVTEEIPVDGVVLTKKVLLGHPNFNFIKNEDGSVAIESREIVEEQLQHIEDVGYVENGKVLTKSRDTGINTTFISKSIESSKESKVPFVVITKGGVRFAYPVKALAQQKQDLDGFKDIFESELRPVDKVIEVEHIFS